MTTSEKDITRGHELYLRHLLLLGQAAPVSLKAILEREVSKRYKRLGDLLVERKDSFKTYHNAEFRQLFKDEEVNTDIDSWDTLVLCVVVLVLFDSYLVNVEVEAIKIIKNQRNELENFAHSASITYNTFEEKWVPLHSALLELNKGIHDEMKFECTRMIYSFKSEDIRVNLDLIKRIKQTHDVQLHLQMVVQDKVAPKIHGIPLLIDKALHVATLEADVIENMDIVLSCKVNLPTNKVVWRHNDRDIKEHSRHHISVQDLEHNLTIRNAKFEDNGEYTVDFGDTTSSTTFVLKEKPLKIRKPLHVATTESVVRENMDIVLTCEVNRHTNKAVWRHNGHIIEEHTRRVVSIDDLEHRLTIRNTKFEDGGDYTVYIGGVTSSVNLIIKGQPVSIIENLHITTNESDATMHNDIVLLCTIDQPTNNPVWRHNNKEIKPSDRLLVSVEELKHGLTIRDATLEDEGDYTVDFGDAKSSTSLSIKEKPVFTKRLQDTFVYVGEPAIIACKLNVSGRAVTWRHDYQLVEATDNLKLVAENCTHWLAILNTKLTDSGYYSCVCGLESTKAYLNVSERPLMITKELHVATTDVDVRENMDIVLICSVNLHTNDVIWQHDGKDITQGIRHLVAVQGLEHKLTIWNAKFEDDGDYTVAFGEKKSSTNLTIKGNVNLLHKKQLTEDLFKNWIRGALGIKYLKLGIQEFAENSVQSHHFEITKQLPSIGKVCTNCTEDVLLPSHTQGQCPKKTKCLCSKQRKHRRICPNRGFCSEFYDKIFFDHRFFDLTLKNTDVQSWGIDPWSVAMCYINTTGYRGKQSAKEVDCSGLLSLLINNNFFHRSLGDIEINGETDLFQQARNARNDILHNANYELSEGQLQCYIDLFKSVLEIKDAKGGASLSGQPGVQDAIGYLNELKNKQIDIRIFQDFQKQIQEIKELTRGELAEKIEQAENQNCMKIQQLEQQLKMTEKDLQLMRDLRSTPAESKPKVPFELDLHIQVNGPTGEISTEGNQRIHETMKNYLSIRNMKTDAHINSTDQSVNRLLGNISTLKDCKISDGLRIEKSVCVKIHCFSCEAIEVFLKLINGNEFQEEVVVLQKCLEREEHIKVHDVIVSCSSESIGNTRKRLYGRGSTRDFTCSNHQGTQCTWYCSDHDVFCCSTCKESDHRSCVGLKQVVSERSYGKQNQTLAVKRKIGDYNVQIKNRLINRDDNDEDYCIISSIRMLPDGNVLLLDNNNGKLKKLDSSYNVVSHCDFPVPSGYGLTDVCYIGDGKAVVCSMNGRIQYVNVSGKMKLEHNVQLDHKCYGLVCHGDTLYVGGDDAVYTYTIHCKKKNLLYNIKTTPLISHIAVSDDGERIYITNYAADLITIDNKGNHLFTLKSDLLQKTVDVGVVGDGTILVLDFDGTVHQVDYSGKQVLGAVVDRSYGLSTLKVVCFDRKRCRLILSLSWGSYISVFNLQQHDSDTDINQRD